jgi:hypothetical protein
MVTGDEVLSADQLAQLALLVSAVGVAGVLTLALMFAIETPRGGPYVFGAINDALGGLYNLAVLPLIRDLSESREAGPGWRLLTNSTLIGSALSAASSFLLVLKVLPFAPSTAVSAAGVALQSAWFLGLGIRRREPLRHAAGLLQLARLVGCSGLLGLPLLAAGFLFPKKSAGRTAAYATGGAIGGGAWAAMPVLWFLAARALRER